MKLGNFKIKTNAVDVQDVEMSGIWPKIEHCCPVIKQSRVKCPLILPPLLV